jgi:hypothetical protein
MPPSLLTLAGKAARVFRTGVHSAVFKTLAAGIVVIAGIASIAAPASAAPTATISRNIYLAAESNGGATVPAEPGRHIYLAAGTYTFGYTLTGPNGTAQDSRSIYLAAGWYWWNCVIGGTEAAYPDDNYDTACSLLLASGTSPEATVPASAGWPTYLFDTWVLAPGNWSWVGYLTPHF